MNCLICNSEIPSESMCRKYCSDDCYKKSVIRKAVKHNLTKTPEEKRMSVKKSIIKLMKRTKDHLGGKCVYCGCDNYDILELNHINGGGTKEKKGTLTVAREVLKGLRTDIELTCSICNMWHNVTKLRGISDNWTITWKKENVNN